MKRTTLILVVVLGILVVGGAISFVGVEKYTSRPEFCGLTCHIMEPYYETWKKDKHKTGKHSKIKKDTTCVDCHYAPGEKLTLRAKAMAAGQLFNYLGKREEEVRLRAKVNDLACTTADCHPKENSSQKDKDKENFFTKKIDYKKAYKLDYKGVLLPFTHKTHLEKTIEGQKLHCASCHMHNDPDKHFNVPIELCFICHFRKAKENEGRAKCSVCHEIPTKAFKEKKPSGGEADDKSEKPVTHQTLEKAKVPCSSCHFEIVKGSKNDVSKESCVECHHIKGRKYIAKMYGKDGKKLMHDAHVAKQTARCFDCHQNIEHKNANYLDAAIQNCATCHPEPHLQQKLLLAGEGGKGIDKAYPIKHHDMKTNCMGCHTKEAYDAKGRKIKVADDKTCVDCHNKEAGETMKKWTKDMAEALKEAKAVEKEAIEALEKAKGGGTEKELQKAIASIKKGQDNLRLVDAGGGAHNKKFATLLLDTAIADFEEAIAALKTKK